MQIYPPGTRIGEYEIASLPMIGGMGVVYFALDHGNDGRPVALKTFRPELLPDRAARDRFLREGTAWIELGNHPHIVRCYKVEYIDPTPFLALELIAKEQNMPDASLRSWLIPGRPLPLEQALLFALQIARGMQYATEKIPGFVHRDLKPENILVGVDRLPGTNINRLRVTDFGLVKSLAGSGKSLVVGNVEDLKPNAVQFTRGAGTPLYMAPEQWEGEPVGVFTDVYAFGCLLYEMLTGQHAAEGETIAELQRSHCNGELTLPPGKLPKNVAMALAKCTASIPTERYETWIEIIDELKSAYYSQSGQSVLEATESKQLATQERMHDGSSYNVIGAAYLNMGKIDVALGYFEKALLIAREAGDQRAQCAALGNLGSAYRHLGDLRRAIGFYEQALVIDREMGDRRSEGADLGNLGNVYQNFGDARRAISFYEQALIITSKFDNEYEGKYEKEVVLSNLGNAYADLGEFEQAIEFLEQSTRIAREIGDRRGQGRASGNLGSVYFQIGNIGQAIKLYEQQLAVTHEIGDRSGEGDALGRLGVAYAELSDFSHCLAFFEQQLIVMREINDRRGVGLALGNLGNAYRLFGDVPKAIECIKQALAIHQEIGDQSSSAVDLFMMAVSFYQLGDHAGALPMAEEAARIFTEIGSPNVQQAQVLVLQLRKNA